ncbi:MAG: hypothetical protein OXN24_02190 [Candidatus Dadabacteria bacterium]|nr:hypothetical protein [Candidatus Dadabacteria bacterium]
MGFALRNSLSAEVVRPLEHPFLELIIAAAPDSRIVEHIQIGKALLAVADDKQAAAMLKQQVGGQCPRESSHDAARGQRC